ncbi:MAG: 3'-5' exonuclease [Thermodesulfobacteriota bacterium]|nr:3'-5' exonuclease [Thermodesulfobacteriota bacterium]
MKERKNSVRPGFDRRMTKEEINNCPIRKWNGPVHIIRSSERMTHAVEHLRREAILGFDTETRPAFKKGQKYLPSLLQLAGENSVYLFQLKHLGLQEPLIKILADPAVIKAGVSLAHDLRELKKLTLFTQAGFVGLGKMSKEKGIQNHGLRGLAAVVLGLRISKSAQTTNWAKDELTQSQIRYAATDAWVGRELYLKLTQI